MLMGYGERVCVDRMSFDIVCCCGLIGCVLIGCVGRIDRTC